MSPAMSAGNPCRRQQISDQRTASVVSNQISIALTCPASYQSPDLTGESAIDPISAHSYLLLQRQVGERTHLNNAISPFL